MAIDLMGCHMHRESPVKKKSLKDELRRWTGQDLKRGAELWGVRKEVLRTRNEPKMELADLSTWSLSLGRLFFPELGGDSRRWC